MKIRKMFEGKDVVQYQVGKQWVRVLKDGSGSVQVSIDGWRWLEATRDELQIIEQYMSPFE
jgi:hypothetical protein